MSCGFGPPDGDEPGGPFPLDATFQGQVQPFQGRPELKLGTATIKAVAGTTERKWRIAWVDAVGVPGAVMVTRLEDPESGLLLVPQLTDPDEKGQMEFEVDDAVAGNLSALGAAVEVFRMMKVGNTTGPCVREVLKVLV